MSKKTILILVKTALPLGLGVYLFWLFFSSMSEEQITSFKRALSEANYFWIALSLIFSFMALYARAARWKYMLEPLGYKTPIWNRYHALMIGYLINFTIPRAGEPSRAVMLHRSDGVPFSKSFGTIVGERVFDVLMLGLVTGIALLIGRDDLMKIFDEIANMGSDTNESESSNKILIYSVLTVIFIGFALLLGFKKRLRLKIVQFLKDVLKGSLSIFKTKNPSGFILYTLLIWACYLLMFMVPFYSLSETSNFPLSGFLIGFVAGSVGISLTNGGIGVYPLLVGMVVSFYIRDDYPTEADGIGKALGMIVWISQTFFMIALGLLSLILIPKNYSKENDKTRESSEQNS